MAKYRKLYCLHCSQERLFRKPRVHHLQSLALVIITGGIYLPFWVAAAWRRFGSPWRCRTCQHSHRPNAREPMFTPPRRAPVEAGQEQHGTVVANAERLLL
jgi:hypothetical protein